MVPAICVVDNDDFRIDTLTGESKQAHRTNVMFVQPEAIENKVGEIINLDQRQSKKELSQKLQEEVEEIISVKQYSVPTNASSEPPILDFVNPPLDSTVEAQRKRSVIHALARVDQYCERPPIIDQQVSAYSGTQAFLHSSELRSKAYYQATYPEPPSKSVMNDIMLKNVEGMKQKSIPFMFLVGDLPTYVHIEELRAENPVKF